MVSVLVVVVDACFKVDALVTSSLCLTTWRRALIPFSNLTLSIG